MQKVAVIYIIVRRSKQIELSFAKGTWGGRRVDAGRREGPNPRVRHLSREGVERLVPCHVTLKVVPGLRSLRRYDVVREIESSFRAACERGRFRLVHYSIQDDHAHLIVEASSPEALGRGMMSIASRFARAVNRALGRTGKVLADRYHLSVLSCPRQARNVLAYVLLNARRHAAKRIAKLRRRGVAVAPLPAQGTLDGASSARWFPGWRSEVAVDRSPPRTLGALPAVAEPKSWFLTAGWRRHGLLDPNEIPGGLRA
jgi:REP-associated tyrosine transposase